ncbi:MAG TPA: S1/P1 nuclease [Pyrinomonadaceae bacterium]|jgi:subtilisin family serine protease
MDEVTLKMGNDMVKLVKSQKYIAIKPRPGVEHRELAELAPELVANASPSTTLGGFQVINVADADYPAEERLDALRADPAVSAGTHVFHTSDDEVPFVPTGQIYIEYAPEASPAECQKLLEDHGLQIVEARGERELIAQVTAESMNPLKVADALQKSPLVSIAEPDLATPGQIQAFILPTDPRIIDQWHLRNRGFHRGTAIGFSAGADARVTEAWERAQSLGSPNVVVAVIDDGFDLSHPDLTGDWKIVAPKDFTRNSGSPVPDPLNEDWHGTACAGVAVGNADGTGIAGAAPRSRLMPIRWGRNLSDGELESWFNYVREQGAWVVSCSWGARARVFPLNTRPSRAIERCAREGRDGLGTVICFAAGNENRDINVPAVSVNGFAIHPDVIAVAASNSRDQRSHYSNFGDAISICAPSSGAGGWGITTSDVMGQYTRGSQTFESGYSPGAYTDDFGGTSSATPLVAGVCALLLSVRPTLTAVEVKALIERTARRIGPVDSYVNGHSREFGHGCVDAAAAVAALLAQDEAEEAWGEKGHETINELAISALPSPLKELYTVNLPYIVKHAMDADNAKQTDQAERPRHFIDFDEYGEYPFPELPEDYKAAVNKFGKSVVVERGLVPWQIELTYGKLVKAFKDKDGQAVLKHSAWLGHYVGDVHVPLHTTSNHDGQKTGQKGLHSYFESQLLNEHVSPGELKPKQAQQLHGEVHALAFEWARESFTYVQPILDADLANRYDNGKRNLSGFAKTAKPIAVGRLTRGATRTASLWYTAWVEAGKVNIKSLGI